MCNPPSSPWLSIPPADYEGHMASPGVEQLGMLSTVFAQEYMLLRPRSVAVLGCATGNGFEQIDPAITGRVLGVDFNPQYLELARTRHAVRLPQLELACLDLRCDPLPTGPFELIWAGLIFEYADPQLLLPKIALQLGGGRLLCVLQLPAEAGLVSASPYSSIKALAPVIHLVEPVELKRLAALTGLKLEREQLVETPGGKTFYCAVFAA